MTTSCQNWRADVSVGFNDDGSGLIESVKYDSYGTPINIPAGDYDLDGDVDMGIGENQAKTWEGGSYRARADLNLDGTIDTIDTVIVTNNIGLSTGRGVLSRNDTASRKGYAGYESDATADAGNSRFWHVRHRVLDSTLGRWLRRDPLGYIDGMLLYNYAAQRPILFIDPLGLIRAVTTGECIASCIAAMLEQIAICNRSFNRSEAFLRQLYLPNNPTEYAQQLGIAAVLSQKCVATAINTGENCIRRCQGMGPRVPEPQPAPEPTPDAPEFRYELLPMPGIIDNPTPKPIIPPWWERIPRLIPAVPRLIFPVIFWPYDEEELKDPRDRPSWTRCQNPALPCAAF